MDNRTKIILEDMKRQLEEVIVKLNSYTPQQCHDQIIPILEDIEMLESGLNGGTKQEKINDPLSTNPQFTDGMIRGSSLDVMKSLIGDAMGINGPHESIPPQEPNLVVAIQELYQSVIRLDERLMIELKRMPKKMNPYQMENVESIKGLITDIKAITAWMNFKSADIIEVKDEEDEDDKENA